MLQAVFYFATRIYAVNNPSGADAAANWLIAQPAVQAAWMIWLLAAFLSVAAATGLAAIASRKGRRPLHKLLKGMLICIGLVNLSGLWFGPSFASYGRLIRTGMAEAGPAPVLGETIKAWNSVSHTSRSRRTQYYVQARTRSNDGLAAKELEFRCSYQTFTEAKAGAPLQMMCFGPNTCWVAEDFWELSQFCTTALVVAIVNILCAIGFLYLIGKWRAEPDSVISPPFRS